jgi:hypothetical protein
MLPKLPESALLWSAAGIRPHVILGQISGRTSVFSKLLGKVCTGSYILSFEVASSISPSWTLY